MFPLALALVHRGWFVLAGTTKLRSTSAQLRRYTLAAFGVVVHGARARAYGAAALFTTYAALHFQSVRAGDATAPVVDLLHRLNKRLTWRAHTHRVRAQEDARDWVVVARQWMGDAATTIEAVEVQPTWHTHRCPDCSSGTSCHEDCTPTPIEQRAERELYEPRTCEWCAENIIDAEPYRDAREIALAMDPGFDDSALARRAVTLRRGPLQ